MFRPWGWSMLIVGALILAACAPARPWRAALGPAALFPTPTARIVVAFVVQTSTPAPVSTPSDSVPCATLIPVCWDAADQAKVAHICYEEARGLLMAGMASCASTVARRQTEPDWYGASLDEVLVWEQFRVSAALRRPWTHGLPAPPEALAAVAAFLADERAGGCWDYDSFRGVTPAEAAAFVAEAPARRCAVSGATQAMVFFDWRTR